MKRLIAFFVLISLILSLTACSPQEENFYGVWESEPFQLSNSNKYYFSEIFLCPDGDYYEMIVELDSDLVELEYQGNWYLNGNEIVMLGDIEAPLKYKRLSKKLVTPTGIKHTKVETWDEFMNSY